MHQLDGTQGLRIVESGRSGDRAEFAVEIADSCPFFEGHFPGHPVLPGVAQLLLVAGLQRSDDSGAPAVVAEVPFVRFHQPISPGATVRVTLVAAGSARETRFEIRRPGALLSRGTVRWLAPGTGCFIPGTGAVFSRTDPPAIGDLLRHAGPARFVSSVLELSGDSIVCSGAVPADSAFVQRDLVPSFVLIDLAAQAAALLAALGRAPEVPAPARLPGYLVQLREVLCSRPDVRAGEPLVARVAREREAPPLHSYRMCVEAAGAEVLRGFIGLFDSQAEAPASINKH